MNARSSARIRHHALAAMKANTTTPLHRRCSRCSCTTDGSSLACPVTSAQHSPHRVVGKQCVRCQEGKPVALQVHGAPFVCCAVACQAAAMQLHKTIVLLPVDGTTVWGLRGKQQPSQRRQQRDRRWNCCVANRFAAMQVVGFTTPGPLTAVWCAAFNTAAAAAAPVDSHYWLAQQNTLCQWRTSAGTAVHGWLGPWQLPNTFKHVKPAHVHTGILVAVVYSKEGSLGRGLGQLTVLLLNVVL